ncbi:MAG: peroxiredoxin [Sulfuricaulis sp.]|uniref:peroxiredoxin n=1 Tax=Sulfuricaulis sp. TaxID=2003553 RepID=UPI0034A2CCF8
MLTIADAAPDFSLPGVYQGKVKNYSLSDARGQWLVLFFYPADFTFVCPTEVTGFSRMAGDFSREKALIYGVSVDSVESHRSWAEELGGIAYPLLSDTEKKVTRAYQVLHPKDGVAIRATYIIDPEGIIQYSAASNMNVGRSVEETLRVLRAACTGRLCPADWKPGGPTGGSEHKY